MKKIGMIVAVEIDAVLNNMGIELIEKVTEAGYQIYHYCSNKMDLYVLNCGSGEIAAASATQYLISVYNVELIVNFGIVGGLTDEMTAQRLCVVEKVIHYDFDTSAADNVSVGRYLQYPSVYIPTTPECVKYVREHDISICPVICASGDKFIGDSNKKKELNRMFGADICEMEAAGIVLTCNRNDTPCLILKCISDSISGGVEEFRKCVREASEKCFKITMDVIDLIA